MARWVDAIRQAGIDVALVTPRIVTPIYAATRILFNETLRWRHFRGDATIGIDADGYAGMAPDLNALESSRPLPIHGRRASGAQP